MNAQLIGGPYDGEVRQVYTDALEIVGRAVMDDGIRYIRHGYRRSFMDAGKGIEFHYTGVILVGPPSEAK